MDVRVLGPVEASVDGRSIPLGGGKPRALLAMLALNAGSTVSTERLIDGLWGEEPPASASKLVQVYVSQLRKALGSSTDGTEIVTRRHGYELRVGVGTVDAERFERLLARGALREALGLWRGPPLDDVADVPFAGAEIRRLEELRLAALELAIENDLKGGRHREVIAELEGLVAVEPLRERLHAMLMLALYRSGRQADALEVYRHAREVLVEQLGIEPGTDLCELNQAILVHDAALDAPRAALAPAGDGRSALPAPPNRTIGRRDEIGAVGERLRAGSVRLLTLTGAGGVGKTRLALEVARLVEADFPDGARFLSLDSVQRAQDVPAEIVKSLGIVLLSGEAADQAVERFLAARQLLLVADNCEHVLEAAPFIGRLLGSCRGVTVLATSREPLGLQAEERRPVPPLALPAQGSADHPAALAGVDAVALFCERARAQDPEFELGDGNAGVVASICRRLDGLPLAIELAASRCGLLTAAEIAARLDATLGALGAGARDAPARQRTLRATLDWSYELLSDDEKACFGHFAIFVGGASVDAAEAITGASLETLELLVAKSLLVRRRRADSPTRLAMLETVREYALERLAATREGDAVRDRHYRYFVALADCHGTERAVWSNGGKDHLARLDADVANLHAALGWAVDHADAQRALVLAVALGWYWLMRDRYAEAVEWIDRALSLRGTDVDRLLRARALYFKAWSVWPLGRVAEQETLMAEAEGLARVVGDPLLLCQVFQARGAQAVRDGRLAAGETLADEALHWANVAGDEWWAAMTAQTSAMAAGSAAELRDRVDRAASRLEATGNVVFLAELFASAAYGALSYGSDHDASDFVSRALPLTSVVGTPYSRMFTCGNFALAALLNGDTADAAEAFREELTLCRELVVLPLACEGLNGLAAISAVGNDPRRAARLAGAAAAHRYGRGEDVVDARLRANFIEPARMRFRADEWDAAVREGAALSLQDAIAYALEEPRTGAPSFASHRSAPAHPSP
jgi:predicted ATPase/DNA-binding SARP family transcriptional activator